MEFLVTLNVGVSKDPGTVPDSGLPVSSSVALGFPELNYSDHTGCLLTAAWSSATASEAVPGDASTSQAHSSPVPCPPPQASSLPVGCWRSASLALCSTTSILTLLSLSPWALSCLCLCLSLLSLPLGDLSPCCSQPFLAPRLKKPQDSRECQQLMGWCTPLIPVVVRMRQGDLWEFKASLVYIVNFRTARAI